MRRVELRDIATANDWQSVMGLECGPGQDEHLNSMEDIQEEAREEQRAMPHPWAVHDAATGALVGFAMISDGILEPTDEDRVGPYHLWKLLIDRPWQGHGAATLDAVVAHVRTRPRADVVFTTCADSDHSLRGFYLRGGG